MGLTFNSVGIFPSMSPTGVSPGFYLDCRFTVFQHCQLEVVLLVKLSCGRGSRTLTSLIGPLVMSQVCYHYTIPRFSGEARNRTSINWLTASRSAVELHLHKKPTVITTVGKNIMKIKLNQSPNNKMINTEIQTTKCPFSRRKYTTHILFHQIFSQFFFYFFSHILGWYFLGWYCYI